MEGKGAIATMLLCESLLSLLPTMSLRDMPYKLLREYEITPFTSGCIANEKRLLLCKFATIHGDVLFVPHPLVHRVFLPLRQVPARGRKQVVTMLEFLEDMGTSDSETIAKKAAVILVDRLLDELVRTQLIPRVSVLGTSRALVRHGGNVHSVISAEVYARRLFSLEVLPSNHRLYSFLKTALDLTLPDDLYQELQTS